MHRGEILNYLPCISEFPPIEWPRVLIPTSWRFTWLLGEYVWFTRSWSVTYNPYNLTLMPPQCYLSHDKIISKISLNIFSSHHLLVEDGVCPVLMQTDGLTSSICVVVVNCVISMKIKFWIKVFHTSLPSKANLGLYIITFQALTQTGQTHFKFKLSKGNKLFVPLLLLFLLLFLNPHEILVFR